MPFSVEDRSAIKVLRQDKQYGAETLLKMFPNKSWTLGRLKTFLAVRHTRIFRPANQSVMPVRRAGSVVAGRKKTRTAFRQWV